MKRKAVATRLANSYANNPGRILDNTNIDEITGCLIWRGACIDKKRPVIRSGDGTGTLIDPTRLIVPREDSEAYRRTCGNHLCLNKNHIVIMAYRNEHTILTLGPPCGEKNGRHKLTEEEVLYIRRALKAGAIPASLAKRYNVLTTTISMIKLRQRWSHLK